MKYIIHMVVLFCFTATIKATPLIIHPLQDTINDLSLLKDRAVYKAPGGKTYSISFEVDPQTIAPKMQTVVSRDNRGALRTRTVANIACDNKNRFDGAYRKKAKTSIAANNATGTNLAKLIKRLVAMNNKSIKVNRNSPRIKVEDSVVTLIAVYLYAIARESDEDYHIIIGTSGNPAKAKFFNVECSGLPATNNHSYKMIKAARQNIVALLGNSERCAGGYVKFNDHPRVKIVGSLFYDKEHEDDIPGPADFKPKTAWELHPITEFKIL